jgi:hypothetical protein
VKKELSEGIPGLVRGKPVPVSEKNFSRSVPKVEIGPNIHSMGFG